MKIVLANNCLGRARGGIEAWIYHASEALVQLGHEPVLLTFEDQIGENAGPKGVQIVGIKRRKHRIPLFALLEAHLHLRSEFKKLDRELNPHAWWIRSGLMAGSIARKVKAPVLFIHAANMPEYARMERSMLLNGQLIHDTYRKIRWWPYFKTAFYVENRGLKYSYKNMYLSRSRKQEMIDYYGPWVSPKSHVVPPGVDLVKFNPGSSPRDENTLRLVSVCRLVKDKNIQQVIKAVAGLIKKGIRVEYKIAGGDGGYESELRSLIESLGVGDAVTLLGQCSEVDELYRWGDAFILPSVYEGFGNVYLEAMASGLPCIALKPRPGKYLVATDEIIAPGETGYLLEDDEPSTIEASLAQLVERPSLLSEMAQQARLHVEQNFSWPVCVKTLLSHTDNAGQ